MMDAQQILAPAEQILGSWVGNFRILSFLLKRQDIKPLDWRGSWLPASGIFGEKNGPAFVSLAFCVALGWILRGCFPLQD